MQDGEPITVQAVALYSLPAVPPPGRSDGEVATGIKGVVSHLLIPDLMPGMPGVLARWLESRTAVVAPAVPFEDAMVSLSWARKPPQTSGLQRDARRNGR
ncbi:hypothetical protein [Kitasatospora sp. NPDC059327]|uniref:hypothetical protein n=1 Tax=Kitasatospora sp. NPDC059327 TaxID=3346803 RepID=UPI0036AC6A17